MRDWLRTIGLPLRPGTHAPKAVPEIKRLDAGALSAAQGERRQVTVLFIDIVGYTALTSRLDLEDINILIPRYRKLCASCIKRYEGEVFEYVGDGIVAFFGFPRAHEAEAERAVHAARAIVDTLPRMDVPEAGRLQVRIGIATGVVIVKVTETERSAVGETMILGERLQAIAQPGGIIVSERVHRMAGGAFEYEDLGPQRLKGLDQPARAHRVIGLSAAASRFEAATQKGVTPLVGREREIGVLLDRWHLARKGSGQAMLVSGEAGIGKSRTASALRERIEPERIATLSLQCSPYYMDSEFYPMIDNFERALKFGRDEPPESRLDRLESLIVTQYGRPVEDVRFIAGMLSIPCTDRYGALTLSPRRYKEETSRALVEIIESIARIQPTLLLFEDAHWSDPTTLELLDRLLDRLGSMPLLVVLTARPEFQSHWPGHGHVRTLPLTKLNPEQSATLVSRLTGGKSLPTELLDEIVERADGVPLFVEELTAAILESGNLQDEGARYGYAGTAANVPIPSTLHGLLRERLDRAGVMEIAQIGATIGREFGYELLAAVAPMSPAELGDALAQLTGSGLAYQQGEIPHATFTFKHALVQDAAYDSLLKRQRQECHAAIAAAIERGWPDTVEAEPERLAQHYTAAGRADNAVPYWRRAGEIALKRFALSEAIKRFHKGLQMAATLAPSQERDRCEIELRALLGPTVVAQHGWANADVAGILEPAWALAEPLKHTSSYLAILHTLCVHYMCLDRLTESLRFADKLLAAGADAKDDSLEIVGHRAKATSHHWRGDFISAHWHGNIIRETYSEERHFHIATLTNTDPKTGDGIYRGQYLWMLGLPDQAVAASNEKDAHARTRNHPFDLAFALTLGAQVFDFLCEPEELLLRTAEAERIARKNGVPLLSEAMAEISKGIAWLRAGRNAEAVTQLRESIDRLSRTGHRIWISYLRSLQGEALALTGDLDGATDLIDDSIAHIERGEERSHYAEVLRLKGWLLVQQGQPDEAERRLRAAIDVARGQQAKSWELRAATTLARLLADRGDRTSARELLSPVYHWFTEGLGTHDLKAARATLEALERTETDG